MFGEGISKVGEIIDFGVKFDIIDKSGAWFSYGDRKLGQGKEKVKDLLNEDPELAKELEDKVRNELGVRGLEAEISEDDDI
jgi:recombination protein RecA